MTPAQAAGGSFVTDVPVQGPTDPGMRSSACQWAASLPKGGTCVDCTGTLPPWLKRATAAGVGERVELRGRPIVGFS